MVVAAAVSVVSVTTTAMVMVMVMVMRACFAFDEGAPPNIIATTRNPRSASVTGVTSPYPTVVKVMATWVTSTCEGKEGKEGEGKERNVKVGKGQGKERKEN